jgi:peptidoglycan/xylan/chitin deacetylase (PgdA/CDA1 family)
MMNRKVGVGLVRWLAPIVVLAVAGFYAYEAFESPGNQIFGKTLVNGPDNAKVVALTYDDGPNPPYTNAILDVLKRERVHATFFLVGQAVDAYPGVVRREAREGNALGNHTWEHEHLIVRSRAQVRESLLATDAAIYHAADVHTHIMRPPYGARDWLVLQEAQRLGYTPVMWSVPLARDWEYPPASVIAARILKYVGDGSIIVLHDGDRGIVCGRAGVAPRVCDRSSDIAATQMIVDALKARGYRFVTIPELIQLRGTTRTSVRGNE